jgi:hypothetical protein
MKKMAIVLTALCVFCGPVFSAPTIKVTHPTAGDQWCAGGSYVISWTKSGAMDGFVRIRLWQNGAKVLDITDNAPNSGSFTWAVPANNPHFPANTFQVKVVTVDNQVSDMSPQFSIKNCASITVVKPDASSCWDEGKDYMIQWTKTGSMDGHVRIQMLKHGAWLYNVAENVPNTGSYSHHVTGSPYWPDYNLAIRIQTMDGAVTGTGQDFPIATGCGGAIDWKKYLDKFQAFDIGWKIPVPGPDPECPNCLILDLVDLIRLLGHPPGPVEVELVKGGVLAARLGRLSPGGHFEPNLAGKNKYIGENGLQVELLNGANPRAIIGDSGFLLRLLSPGTRNVLGTRAVRFNQLAR